MEHSPGEGRNNAWAVVVLCNPADHAVESIDFQERYR